MCVLIAQSYPTLCNPIDCSPPGPSIHGILQARTLEWVAISFSKRNYRCLAPGWPQLRSGLPFGPRSQASLHIPVLLPGESHGWRGLVGCSPWGCKELEMTEVT